MRTWSVTLAVVLGALAATVSGGSAADQVAIGERAATARAAAEGMRGSAPDDLARRRQVAESVSYDDPEGDTVLLGETAGANTPAAEPRADLVRGGAAYDAAGIDLTAELAAFTDPLTDPGWRDGESSLLWVVDTDADGEADYEVVYFADDTRIAAQVFRPGDRTLALCDASGLVEASVYRVADLPAACLGSPPSFISYVSMNYDAEPANPGTQVYGDVAPDEVYSAPVGPAGGAGPTPARETGRLAGVDRFQTSVVISRFRFPDGAADVYLARADEASDALSGGSLTGGPVLLVPQCGTLPQVIADEIARLDPQRVVALGGRDAICDAVLAQAAA